MGKRKTAQDYHNLATSRGITWIGDVCPTTNTPTEWECSAGHQWKTSHSNIYSGTRCPVCYDSNNLGFKHKDFVGCGELSGRYFHNIENHANVKKPPLEFSITKEQVWELFLKQNRKCAISNCDIEFGVCLGRRKSPKYRQQTASLDRIDSSKGYVIDNVQWVHKIVNIMKQDLSDEKFISWCKRISDFNVK